MTAQRNRERSYQQMLCQSHLTRSIESLDVISSSQATIRPPVNIRNNHSVQKRNAVQKQIMKKRIEATEKFNKEFN